MEAKAVAVEMGQKRLLKDGLSSPVTIACCYHTMIHKRVSGGSNASKLHEVMNSGKPLHFVVIGACAANEEVL